MRRIVRTVVAALGSLFALLPVAAQEERLLTFDEALAMVDANNPALRAADYQLRAAEQERRAAIGLRMPRIGITGAYAYLGKDMDIDLNGAKGDVNRLAGQLLASGIVPTELIPSLQGLISPMLGADWSLRLQDRSLGFVGGEVTVPIFMGGKINAANRAARIGQQEAEASGAGTRNALVSELVERYFGLALAEQVVAVREQVAEGMRRHLADAEALERSGMIASSERLYVAFKTAEAERELANARLQRKTVADALNNTLGAEGGFCRPVTGMFLLTELEGVDYYRQQAVERNPLLAQVELKRRLAQEGAKAQRADFMPQIVAMGGASFYNYQVTGILPRWAVGVGVRLKLFDGLSREYNYSSARHTVRRVEALAVKAEEDIATLVGKLYNQMTDCANRIVSIDASIAFAEEYLKVKNAAFLEGMSSSSDLIDAELNLAAVRVERMQAACEYDLLLAKLLEAAGMSDEFSRYIRRPDARQISFE